MRGHEQRLVAEHLAEYTLGKVLGENREIIALELESPDRAAVLKVSYTAHGDASLRRAAAALLAVHAADPPNGTLHALPRLIAGSFDPGRTWTVETRCRGVNAEARPTSRNPELVKAVAATMAPVYERTHLCAEDTVEQVDALARRLDAIAGLPASPLRSSSRSRRLGDLRHQLIRDLARRPLTTALVHGDLWLGNTLFDPWDGRVTGIVDWEASHRGLPAVEMVHLVTTTRARASGIELGTATRGFLAHEDWREDELVVVRNVPGGTELPLRTLLLLAWVCHIHANVRKSPRYARNPVWVARNVHQVLEML
jgi:hypothetical protein